jgi:DNA polymerase-1
MLKRDPNCTRCPLHKSAEHVCLIPPDIRRHDVLIVGEAPGHREDETGVPFVGRTGQLLREYLKNLRIRGVITNAVLCRPPENRTPTKGEIKACRYWMSQQLEYVKPKYVLCLGNVAIQSLLGITGIRKRRGQVIEEDGVIYFPTYHPSYISRDPSYQDVWVKDLQRFKDIVDNKGPPEDKDINPVVVDSYRTWDDMIVDLATGGVVAFDIEATGLYPWRGKITTLGFGTRTTQWIIPWNHPESVWRKKLDRCAKELDRVVRDVYLVAQNGKFDCLWMKVKHDVHWKVGFDTMLAHHVLNENSLHDLEYLAQLYFGVPAYDVPLDVKQGHHGIAALAPYQAKDLKYTRQLKFKLAEELDKDPLVQRLFRHLVMPCSDLFMEAEYHGLYIDHSKYDEANKYLTRHLAQCLKKLNKWVPADWVPNVKSKKAIKAGFNWASPKQVGQLLFDTFGIDVVEETRTGAPSTSESVLKRIDHDLVGDLLQFRGAKQQLSFFIDGWRPYFVGKYLHPSFKLHGTTTGRLSSEHPNAQQIPRDPRIRQLISAPNGWELIEADLSQAEMRIAAELSGDPQLMYAFHHDIDVHWLTMMREIGRNGDWPDQVIATASAHAQRDVTYSEGIETLLDIGPDKAIEIDERHNLTFPVDGVMLGWKELRKRAKAVNFGYLYGMWWKKFIIYARDKYNMKISDKQAMASRSGYFQLYKGLLPWHEKQKRLARTDGYVSSKLGRKRRLPEAMLDYDTPGRAEAWRQAINAPVQSLASDLNLLIALQLRKEYNPDVLRICATVHDSILMRVKRERVVDVAEKILSWGGCPDLLNVFKCRFNVPMEAEVKIGPWGRGVSLTKWKVVHAKSA